VVAPLLPALFYLMTERVGYQRARQTFDLVRSSAFQIEALTAADMLRMSQIMTQYEDTAFDYVDTAIMAVSERLNITDVYTLDRRDFLIFRPQH
jgi:predicted nucleic acid-binding protein